MAYEIRQAHQPRATNRKRESGHDAEPSLITLLFLLWTQLSPHRRAQFGAAMLLMLANSLVEVVSLATVLPFLAVLINPATLWNQPLVQLWGPSLGVTNDQGLLFPVTLAFTASAVCAGAIRLFTLWFSGRLAAGVGSDLSCEAYRRTLYQPYAEHVRRNSSSLIASISNDLSIVIGSVLNPLLQSFSSALIALTLVFTLLAIDWFIAAGVGLLIALVYLAAVVCSSRPLQQLSKRQVVLNRQIIQSLQEGLGAIRDVLLDGTQGFYANKYRQADQPLRRGQATSNFLSTFPRLVMEPAGICLLAVVGYLLVLQGDVNKAVPLLGLLAMGAQRLLPMAQKVYEGWAQTRNAKNSLVNVLALLAQPLPADDILAPPEPLNFDHSLRFEGVSFRYLPSLPEVVKRIDLEIRRGERIGLIGSTGSGKSTLIDLLMCLLQPTTGRILVDGQDLNDIGLIPAWRASIAHVPQSIYLADSSVSENIAFGIPKEQVDEERVRHAAEQAQIAPFIESMTNGYSTFVGERGVRLSGGQRQRIGIARALYKQSRVLVLDEATAALDNDTELAVMEAVEGLSRELTVVMIAHRLSTVQRCDRIIKIEQGSIISDMPPA